MFKRLILLLLFSISSLFAQMSSYKGTYQDSWRINNVLLRTMVSDTLYILNYNDSSNANIITGWHQFSDYFSFGKDAGDSLFSLYRNSNANIEYQYPDGMKGLYHNYYSGTGHDIYWMLKGKKIPDVTFHKTGTVSFTFLEGDVIPKYSNMSDIGSYNHRFRKGWFGKTSSFSTDQNTDISIGGTLTISKNTGTLATAITDTQDTIDFGQQMTLGDIVVLKVGDYTEYLRIDSLATGINVAILFGQNFIIQDSTGIIPVKKPFLSNNYWVTRNLAGGVNMSWAMGTPYSVRGNVGDGWIELSATGTPKLSLFTQGSTWNSNTELFRAGELNGMPGYTSKNWGIYIGSATNYLTYNTINGLRIAGNGSALDITANLTILGLDGSINLNQTNISQNTTDILLRATTVALNDTASIHWAQIGINADSIRSNVVSITSVDGKTTINTSNINQNATSILQRVRKDSVIAFINLTAETATISANHIEFLGSSIFKAINGTGDSTSINGGKIKSGLIESNNWSATLGSQYDLTNGTIKLGGSTSPNFSVDSSGFLTASGVKISGDGNLLDISSNVITTNFIDSLAAHGISITANTDSFTVIAASLVRVQDSVTVHRAVLSVNTTGITNNVLSITRNADSVVTHRAELNINADSVGIISTRTLVTQDTTTQLRGSIVVNGNGIASNVSSISTVDGKTTTNASNITQLSDTLSFWVRKDSVISFINLSSESVDISSTQINITGTSVFSNGLDLAGNINAGTTTISGALIKSGLIESNNWSATLGSQYDLTLGTIKLGGSTSPNFSVTAAGVLTASGVNIAGSFTATNLTISNDFNLGNIMTVASGGKIMTAGAGVGANGFVLDIDGIRGYSAILGEIFKLPTDGSAPIFSSGIIKNTVYQIYTSGVIRTSATVGDGTVNSAGILINNTGIYGLGISQIPSTANFRLLASTGVLTATNVDLTGKITATSGAFSGSINASSGTFSGYVQAGTGTNKMRFGVGVDGGSNNGIQYNGYNFWYDSGYFEVGDATNSMDYNVTTANTLTLKGNITSTATITGGTISGTTVTGIIGTLGALTVNGTLTLGTGGIASTYFNVTNTGLLTATNVNITGTINAIAGTFSGSLSAATGTFNGNISGASGTFTGALSGSTITGSTIVGSTIRTSVDAFGYSLLDVSALGFFTPTGNQRGQIGYNPMDTVGIQVNATGDLSLATGTGDILFSAGSGLVNFQSSSILTSSHIVVGSPTGGAKGVGTINATAVYDDNILLTDYIFEPAYKYSPIKEMTEFYKTNKHLPTIRTWKDEKDRPSLGGLLSDVYKTVEVQALYISELEKRISKLENQRKQK